MRTAALGVHASPGMAVMDSLIDGLIPVVIEKWVPARRHAATTFAL
ncbi:hypothetical protein [Streptomyces sp. MP131-18]|nr:hypothetical protein [Streptomyces sp. MP131-18]ONK15214.1 hypothetical protein STBA_60290 [Streptomyces sp. MP131-18]